MAYFGELKLTIVGNDIYDQVMKAVEEAGISVNQANPVNQGRLGNFMTLTVFCEISEQEVIVKRRRLMDILMAEGSSLMALYEHGNWMSVYIFKRTAWKSRREQSP